MSWGSVWGGGAWGGGSLAALTVESVLAVRENVFRVTFNVPVYYSSILDPPDAARIEKYAATPVAGSTGLDGSPARAVLVARVDLIGEDGEVVIGGSGRRLDVVLDRPMTPHAALYDVSLTDVFAADLGSSLTTTIRTPAVFKEIVAVQVDSGRVTRDFANPQTLRGAIASGVALPDAAELLGTFRIDAQGDYAFDEGVETLRKRVVRRLVTVKGGFAHLPTYGVGITTLGKRLAVAATLATVAADAEAQIRDEPDVAEVAVRPVIDPAVPSIVRFQIRIRTKEGKPTAFDVPVIARG